MIDAPSSEDVIKQLELEPLPHEGGYFRRVYTAGTSAGERALASAIYFLIDHDQFSAMHRLDADELFHFYMGDPAELLLLSPDGSGRTLTLGNELHKHQLMAHVPAGTWQGMLCSKPRKYGFTLLGVSVHPAFVWETFELGKRDSLAATFPNWAAEIKQRTRA